MCERQFSELKKEGTSIDTANAHEGLFHSQDATNPTTFLEQQAKLNQKNNQKNKQKNDNARDNERTNERVDANEKDEHDEHDYDKYPKKLDGSHLFMKKAQNEIEKVLEVHVGKRYENNNMNDNDYISFVEITTQMLASHHANVHSKQGVWTHEGKRITLSQNAIKSNPNNKNEKNEKMTELYNNATLLFDTWRHSMNVTKDSMQGYWRGQDEDWVADAREAAMDLWEERVRKARSVIGASKVKAMMNKRALERALTTLPKGFDTKSFEKVCLKKMLKRCLKN